MKLKSLSKYFLQEEIQEGQDGHDSGEDARAAQKLVYGIMCAYGNSELKDKYSAYKEIGCRIAKRYKATGEKFVIRLQEGLEKLWYQFDAGLVYNSAFMHRSELPWNEERFHPRMPQEEFKSVEQFGAGRVCLVAELDYSSSEFWDARKDILKTLKEGMIAIWVISVKDGKRSVVLGEVVGNARY